jgi:hypothetical protein
VKSYFHDPDNAAQILLSTVNSKITSCKCRISEFYDKTADQCRSCNPGVRPTCKTCSKLLKCESCWDKWYIREKTPGVFDCVATCPAHYRKVINPNLISYAYDTNYNLEPLDPQPIIKDYPQKFCERCQNERCERCGASKEMCAECENRFYLLDTKYCLKDCPITHLPVITNGGIKECQKCYEFEF